MNSLIDVQIAALRAQQARTTTDAAWDALERQIEPLLDAAWVEDFETDKYRSVE